jgi:hypothetical protein
MHAVRPSDTPVVDPNDVTLDDPLPEGLNKEDDGRPHWLWVRVPSEGVPEGLTVQSAPAPKPGSPGVLERGGRVPMAAPPDPTVVRQEARRLLETEVGLLKHLVQLAGMTASPDRNRQDRRLDPQKDEPKAASVTGPTSPPEWPDDTIVDQKTVRGPKELYLRLAREGAFPSRKIGKRICARWGDVKAAFAPKPGIAKAPAPAPAESPPTDDGLDDLRQNLGFMKKGA